MNILQSAFMGAAPHLNCFYYLDALKLCSFMPPACVDMTLIDLPYSATRNQWDKPISLRLLWRELLRITTPGAALVFTASQPFTSKLVMSNLKMFRYEWIWNKGKGTQFLDSKRKPLKSHESVLVFCQQAAPYFPQMRDGTPYQSRSNSKTSNYGKFTPMKTVSENGDRYPVTVLDVPAETLTLHPTQKPVQLMQYLIKTYTQPGAVVFDCCVGSGTTAIAAAATGRHFVAGDNGIDEKTGLRWIDIAQQRVNGNLDEYQNARAGKPFTPPLF